MGSDDVIVLMTSSNLGRYSMGLSHNYVIFFSYSNFYSLLIAILQKHSSSSCSIWRHHANHAHLIIDQYFLATVEPR